MLRIIESDDYLLVLTRNILLERHIYRTILEELAHFSIKSLIDDYRLDFNRILIVIYCSTVICQNRLVINRYCHRYIFSAL